MRVIRGLTVVLALVVPFVAASHGKGGKHFKGVVAKIDAPSLTLTTDKGETVVVATDGKTQFTRGEQQVALSDVVAGEKAVIHARMEGEKLIADLVKLGKAPPRPDAGSPPKQEKPHDHAH